MNSTFPAATASRAQACQRVVDAIIGALAPAIPDRAVAAANGSNTALTFYGRKPESGQYYVYIETYGGGSGGRAHKDGKDGVQVHITNTSNLPIEALEQEYPLFIENYTLVPDSGGPGQYRGGLGLQRDIRIVGHTCEISTQAERFRIPPWGLFNGKEAQTGAILLRLGTPSEASLPSKTSGIEVKDGEIVRIRTPGGGGYGPPQDRATQAVQTDLREGKISLEHARKFYRTEEVSAPKKASGKR